MNRGFAIFLIVLVGCGLFGWREYERQMREKVYKKRMLKAKKEGAKSFEYKNKTYYGREHDKLGMVYSSKRPKTV